MLSWSNQKKFLYLLLALFVLGLVAGIPVYFKFVKKAPTCFDGKLNQDEKGIDCGGVCVQICNGEAIKPIVLFERYFKVAPGVHNAVVLVENNNIGLYALRVPYVMRFYDKDSALLAETYGETFMSNSKLFPVIEYSINTQARDVARMTFEFLGEIDWKRGVYPDPKVEIQNKILREDKGKPRIQAEIVNNEVYKISNIPVVALVYGNGGNLIASSHTLVDEISGKGRVPIVFTWNEGFSEVPAKTEIIPRLIPRELTR